MSLDDNKSIVQEWSRLFRQGDINGLQNLAHKKYSHHGMDDSGFEALRDLLLRSKDEGVDWAIADMIAESDRVAVWFVNKGKRSENQSDTLSVIFRIEDDKVIETITPKYYLRD